MNINKMINILIAFTLVYFQTSKVQGICQTWIDYSGTGQYCIIYNYKNCSEETILNEVTKCPILTVQPGHYTCTRHHCTSTISSTTEKIQTTATTTTTKTTKVAVVTRASTKKTTTATTTVAATSTTTSTTTTAAPFTASTPAPTKKTTRATSAATTSTTTDPLFEAVEEDEENAKVLDNVTTVSDAENAVILAILILTTLSFSTLLAVSLFLVAAFVAFCYAIGAAIGAVCFKKRAVIQKELKDLHQSPIIKKLPKRFTTKRTGRAAGRSSNQRNNFQLPYCLAESAAEVFVLSPPEPLQKRQDKKSQARQDVAQDWIEMTSFGNQPISDNSSSKQLSEQVSENAIVNRNFTGVDLCNLGAARASISSISSTTTYLGCENNDGLDAFGMQPIQTQLLQPTAAPTPTLVAVDVHISEAAEVDKIFTIDDSSFNAP